MLASSLTVRAGLRTVSPATRTLPARIRACARSRDSARLLLATSTSRRGITRSDDQAYGKTDHRAHEHFERGVSKQLAQTRLLHASHVHQVLDEPIQDLGLTAGRAAQTRSVVHDHKREDKGDRERGGTQPGIFTNRGGEAHHDRAVAAGHASCLRQYPEVDP